MEVTPDFPSAVEPETAPDRWRTASWAQLLPGLGQLHNGQKALGVVLLGTNVTLVLALLLAVRNLAIPGGVLYIGFGLILLLLSGSLIHAYRVAADASPGAPPSAWRAAFWSHSAPGLGQALERRFLIGIGLFVAAVLATVPSSPLISIPLGLLVTLAAAADALFRSRRGPVAPRAARAFLVAVAIYGVAGPLITVLLRANYVQSFRNPSLSMAPTLRNGDYFFVDKTRAGHASVGDLLVFRYPQDRTKDFVKRCVAIAGQTVEVRDQRLLVNGLPVDEPYVIHLDPNVRAGEFDARDNLAEQRVPPGCVFVMGDNRENSNDSRYWGPLALSDVKGRALRIYWPPDRLEALSPARR